MKIIKTNRTQYINKLQRKFPGSRRERLWNGIEYSVKFYDKKTEKLLGHFDVPYFSEEK